VPLPDGRRLPFPVPRLKMMLGVLMDLFEPKALDDNGHLRLTKLRAAELSGATGAAAFRWLGGDSLRQLNEKLRDFRSIRAVRRRRDCKPACAATSRRASIGCNSCASTTWPASWPTTWAWAKRCRPWRILLEEKKSGRADRPSLVVAPTSLMTNWRQEAERFAPALKLLVLHGQERKQYFEKLKEYDLSSPPTPCCRATRRFWSTNSFT
jgi:hypothetical protein